MIHGLIGVYTEMGVFNLTGSIHGHAPVWRKGPIAMYLARIET